MTIITVDGSMKLEAHWDTSARVDHPLVSLLLSVVYLIDQSVPRHGSRTSFTSLPSAFMTLLYWHVRHILPVTVQYDKSRPSNTPNIRCSHHP